ADLEVCRAALAEPLSVALDAGLAFNTPPPTQGLASLIILALFERLRIPQGEGFDHIHTLVEATKRAFGVRDRVITDPDDLPHPVDRYLDAKFLDADARTIDRRMAARRPRARGPGRHRLDGPRRRLGPRRLLRPGALRGIRLRRGAAPDRVLMQNRGASFSLQSGALNSLQPGRLPLHTLNPALAVLADGRIV